MWSRKASFDTRKTVRLKGCKFCRIRTQNKGPVSSVLQPRNPKRNIHLMHEEPYTQALLDMVLAKAGGKAVTEIRLAVGQFSAIVPAAVEIFFRHLSEGTRAQGAVLVFETRPVELTCPVCGTIVAPEISAAIPIRQALGLALGRGCTHCEGRLKITGGLGFDLIDLTVDDGIRPAPPPLSVRLHGET